MALSNRESNRSDNRTPSYEPTDAEREMLKREHALSWHPKGGWCRRMPGDKERTYFGKLPSGEAVRAMLAEESRRTRREDAQVRLTRLTLREAVNLYLTHLDQVLAAGNLSVSQRASYGDELARMAAVVGKGRKLVDFTQLDAPEELFAPLRAAAIARGVFAAEKHIVQVRTFFDWCSTTRRFMSAPFYADAFDAPTEKEKRNARKAVRKEKGSASWEPEHVREIVAAAKATDVHRYAQVLLMLNGGMGSTDVSNLEDGDVDWGRRCIHTDRSKTLVPPVVPLWDVTLEAMRASRAERAEPAEPQWADRFFLTMHGRPLVVETLNPNDKRKTKRTDALRNWFFALVNPPKGKVDEDGKPVEKRKRERKIPLLPHLKRYRAGAYTLRSVFVTASMGHGQDRNLEAVVLGQQFDRPILEFYLRGDLRDKLRGVVDHVYRQVWPDGTEPGAADAAG